MITLRSARGFKFLKPRNERIMLLPMLMSKMGLLGPKTYSKVNDSKVNTRTNEPMNG